MDKRDLIWIIVLASVSVCRGQQDFIQIVASQKLPMGIKLYVDQFGHSGPPQATFTPVGAGGRSSRGPSLPSMAGLGVRLSGASGFPAGLAGMLRQFGGGAVERESFSVPGGHVETEGMPMRPSMMNSLRMSLGGRGSMNFDPSMFQAGSQAPEGEGTGGARASSIMKRLGLLNSGGGGGGAMFGGRETINLPQDMGGMQGLSQFGLPSQSGQDQALRAKLMRILGQGSQSRMRRQAVIGQQPGSGASMNSILARLKSQLKTALRSRMETRSPNHNQTPQLPVQSGITIFGAARSTPKPKRTNTTNPTGKSKSKAMPDPRRAHIRNTLRKSAVSNRKNTIIKTTHGGQTPTTKLLGNTLPHVGPFNINPKSGGAAGILPFLAGGSGGTSLLSSMLGSSRGRRPQMIREIQCMPGRTVPPEAVTIGPMSEIQRYECVIPIPGPNERLLGTFSVQQGESVTCNVDHDRVQISGEIVQPICIHN